MIKFLLDKFFAFAGLLVASPVMFVVALLIRVKMPDGSVFFCQKRVGRNASLFTIYKFRTMTQHSEGSSVSVAGEARITALGAFLRRYKIDELPELWNVLKGDMSFVGPRPDVPGYADRLQGEARKILELRPGITGPATLKYRDEEFLLSKVPNPQEYNDVVLFPDKVRLNLYYYYHPSLADDCKMFFCTVLNKRMSYAGEII